MTFTTAHSPNKLGNLKRDDFEEVVEGYLAMLAKNGQVLAHYHLVWIAGTLTAYVSVPRPDALLAQHNSPWVATAYDQVVALLGQPPSVKILDDQLPEAYTAWQQSDAFYLFASVTGSVHCTNSGQVIPTYLLPIDPSLSESIYFWNRDYQAIDHIYLSSGKLEILAYEQMADSKSELSITGRSLCAEVERATGKPVYYYLHRYYARAQGEETRPCPLCGSQWQAPLEEKSPPQNPKQTQFHHFSFRCDRCRIVSNIDGLEVNEQYAHIGEYVCD